MLLCEKAMDKASLQASGMLPPRFTPSCMGQAPNQPLKHAQATEGDKKFILYFSKYQLWDKTGERTWFGGVRTPDVFL